MCIQLDRGIKMHFTPALLDAAKAAQGITSDYRLCRVLGVTDHALYTYRRGRTPDDERGLKLAEMAGLDGSWVLVNLSAERAKDPAQRAAYITAATILAAAHPARTVDILSRLKMEATPPKFPRADGLNGPKTASVRADNTLYIVASVLRMLAKWMSRTRSSFALA